ncbi:Card1-like endonuclease domain-containing protein [Chitiniphilus eburneus]|uniref:Card1-like endonuclease domain-containing protein n=1 Tax=Chitiniphilus eburneus TaxID=2571148 RepID=UPI0035D05D75
MHLICLVGYVSTDLVSPLFDRGFGFTRVTLLHDPAIGDAMRAVADVCRKAGLATTVLPLRPRYDPATIRERLEATVAASRQPCVLNLSGATPVQAAIGFEVGSRHALPMFAVEPEADTLVWLSDAAAAPLANGYNIADRMRLEEYFRLYGAEIVTVECRLSQRDAALEGWAAGFAELAAYRPRAILALNALAADVDAGWISRGALHHPQPELAELLHESRLARLLPDGRIAFADRPSHRFLHGGWLERWIFSQAGALVGELPIQDLACGIRIRVDGKVDNEFDVAILCNNQLYLVECKTILAEGVDRATLFKLDSVAHVGGLAAQATLASLSLPTDHEERRAEVQDIALLSGRALLGAAARLRQWLGGTAVAAVAA